MRQAVFHVYYTLKQFDIVQTPIVSYDGRQLLHTKEFVKWISIHFNGFEYVTGPYIYTVICRMLCIY